VGPGWDAAYNYDPDSGVHRGYDAANPQRRPYRGLGPPDPDYDPPPQKPWDELTQLERDRGYDFYGRSVSEPEPAREAGQEERAGQETGPARTGE